MNKSIGWEQGISWWPGSDLQFARFAWELADPITTVRGHSGQSNASRMRAIVTPLWCAAASSRIGGSISEVVEGPRGRMGGTIDRRLAPSRSDRTVPWLNMAKMTWKMNVEGRLTQCFACEDPFFSSFYSINVEPKRTFLKDRWNSELKFLPSKNEDRRLLKVQS